MKGRLSDVTTRRSIQVETMARAPIERVWRAWTDTDFLHGWLAEPLGGEPVFQTLEATPPEHLVLGVSGKEGGEIDIQLVPAGEGTRIRLARGGLPVEPQRQDEVEGVRSGWMLALAVLRVYTEDHFGEAPQLFQCFRRAAFTFERLYPFFRQSPELSRWLVRQGSIGVPGGRSDLQVWDGRRLSGEVLVDSGREISTTWDEIDGVLELRAFTASGGARMLGVRGFTWSGDAAAARQLDELLAPALDRLVAAVADLS